MGHVSRLAKLRAMPLREIVGRATYAAYVALERRLHRSGRIARPTRLRQALIRNLATQDNWSELLVERAGAGGFFSGSENAPAARTRFTAVYREELLKARRVADDVLRHEIAFFGERFTFGPRINWHADPVSAAEWPRTFQADVPIHSGNGLFGDVKYVWEVNRHQFLMDLAKVALLDESDVHKRELQELIDDFMRQAPYATGVAWACALEPAFRAWSWLWAYHMARSASRLDPAFHIRWLTGFYDHGRFLHRHLETYSSPYNHLIGEASALFALGLLFPEFREAGAWVSRGRHVLEHTLDLQFHADGGTVEQSTFYHHATLGFYILSAVLGRRNGVELSRRVWAAIERGIEFSMAVMQPDGRVPRIGGADDGKPIRLEHLPLYDFRPYQAIGAVLFTRADFKYVAGRFWEDAYWILGEEGVRAFESIAAAPPTPAIALPSSGYYVARTGWRTDADYLCFDCGPQAGGLRKDDVPSAAHGHADCLSVIVGLSGREVLVDPGFFCYNGDPAWEVHFRKTAAHNTVSVDGFDQARHLSKMVWVRTYTPALDGWSPEGRLAWVSGSHDGYRRSPTPVTHRRTAWLRPDGYVILHDEITGTGEHEVDVNFQFAPGQLELRDDNAIFDDTVQLRWVANVPLTTAVACGGDGPGDGWIALSLGVRQPAPRLRLTGALSSGRMVVVSVIADLSRAAATASLRLPYALSARIDGAAGWIDEVLGSAEGAVKAPGVDSDAPLVVLRWRSEELEDVAQAGGTRVAVRQRMRPGTFSDSRPGVMVVR